MNLNKKLHLLLLDLLRNSLSCDTHERRSTREERTLVYGIVLIALEKTFDVQHRGGWRNISMFEFIRVLYG